MQVVAEALLESRPVRLKFIVNESGVVFSVPSVEHKEISGEGTSYKDNGGNALAGLIVNGHVEIRGHSVLQFSEDRVRNLWREVLRACPSAYLSSMPMSYQGKPIYTPAFTPPIREV